MRPLHVPLVLFVVLVAVLSAAAPTRGAPSTPSPVVVEAPAPATPASAASETPIAPAYSPGASVEMVGAVPTGSPMGLVVGIDSKDASGLAALAAAESVPGTPVYETHLSSGAARARFGATADDVRTATDYFEGFGLHVSSSPDGLLLYVQGASGSVARAFGTSFEEYRTAAGQTFVSHPTAATLPSIVPWSGALGLSNETQFAPAITSVSPEVAPSAACSNTGDYVPCQIQTAYSLGPLYANGSAGNHVRLAVVDAYSGEQTQDQLEGDLETFTDTEGLPGGNVSYLYPVPTSVDLNSSTTNSAWWLEDALDLEWTRALAPNASIEMTFSPNAGPGLYAAIDALVGNDEADVISLSWGEPDVGVFDPYSGACPAECNASTDGSYEVLGPVLELAAVEGISVFAASGDCGSSGGTAGVSTFFPASDPYVTGVGGTDLDVFANGTWDGETAWPGNSSGRTAPGCSENTGGSGGGYSPFPTPWWQVGPGFAGKSRGVPDVAADAGDPVLVYVNSGGSADGVEGTSVATPIWAGITADLDSSRGSDLGFLNPSLYRILNSSNYSADFHDITSGSNGYNAGVGWDAVTGIGSPIASELARNVEPPTNITETNLTTNLTAEPTFGKLPLAVTFDLTVTGGSGKYALEGVYFGDGNASLVTDGTVEHTFTTAGVYSAQSFVVDSRGIGAISLPVTIVAGGGSQLTVHLQLSSAHPSLGADENFTALASGGTPPYTYSFFFGDGSSDANLTVADVTHQYRTAGVYCPVAIVSDSAVPVDGGASGPVEVAVGGATSPECGNSTEPVTVTANASEGVRDAPADFPSLFVTSGGSAGSNPPTTTTVASTTAYTKACQCTIFPTAGVYEVGEWVNDSAGVLANASTNVTVAPPLAATFEASTFAGPAPLSVEFSAIDVTGGDGAAAANTRWSFGNGIDATGATGNATYATPGEYLAIGSLSDRGYGNASEAFLIDVEPSTGAPPLGATGTISPAVDIDSATTVDFTAQLIGPSNATDNASLRWNLTSGRSAYGPSIDETYFAPLPSSQENTLTPSLSIQNDYLTTLRTIPLALPNFFATESGGFVPSADALALNATVGPTVGVAPVEVRADGNTSGPGGASLHWDFGDAPAVNGTGAADTFAAPGGYTVTAVATDPFNDRAFAAFAVAANRPLGVTGGPSRTGGASPLTVNFTVSAYGGKGPPYAYAWTLPNGSRTAGPDLNLTLSSIGSYTVALTVTDSNGTQFVTSWTLSVTPVPILSFAEIVSIGAGVGVLAALLGVGLRPRRPRSTP